MPAYVLFNKNAKFSNVFFWCLSKQLQYNSIVGNIKIQIIKKHVNNIIKVTI